MPLPTLADLRPALNRLRGVPQDPIFHGEGDAAAHTSLVLEKLHDLPSYRARDAEAQAILTTAAALHDLGKTVCTKREDGRWRSPHHSRAGAMMAREMMMTTFGLCGAAEALAAREAVCALIAWHMRPPHGLEQAEPERAVRQMAALGELAPGFSLRSLTLLAEADCLGRVCDDREDRLADVALFAELAREQGCLDAPFSYPDAFSRYADLSGRNVMPGQALFNDRWGTVTMLSGLPGTGKDTWIQKHLPDQPTLSLDALRAEMRISFADNQGAVIQAARERARELLRRKQPFTFNATNLSTMLRGKWLRLFHDYGASVRIVYLETPWEERERRNQGRKSAVPEEAVLRMLSQMEPPTLTEAEEATWTCV